MTYLVIDLETGSKKSFKRNGNPFDPANQIVAIGLCNQENQVTVLYKELHWDWLNGVDVLVGHNIKYDLLYLWKFEEFQNWLKAGGRIWDTQYAEYRLSGQQETMAGLRDIATRLYGCEPRPKLMEPYWEQGIDTTDIPQELVIQDVTYDVLDTHQILKGQYQKAKQLKMFPLLKNLMDAILATTEMEFNGLYINLNAGIEQTTCLEAQLEALEQELLELIRHVWPLDFPFNLGSNNDLKKLFFGGKITKIEKQYQFDNNNMLIRYKTGVKKGQIKYFNQIKTLDLPQRYVPQQPNKRKKLGEPGKYVITVDEASLTDLSQRAGDLQLIATKLLEWRSISKDIKTYYRPILELADYKGIIHPKLNHCTTVTGRLSSSDPNFQNIPSTTKSDFRKLFESRHGPSGLLIEIDYGQLEVVGVAWLTQDPALLHALSNDLDIHKTMTAIRLGIPEADVTPSQRKATKKLVFGLLYGQEEYGMSKTNGLSTQICAQFISDFYRTYPRIHQWHKEVEYTIRNSATYKEIWQLPGWIAARDPILAAYLKDRPRAVGEYQTIVGSRYIMKEQVRHTKTEIEIGLDTAQMKNYPVQGFATGDIVPIMAGKLFRALLPHRDKCLLINTIHDSFMLDVVKDHAQEMTNLAQKTLESVPEVFKSVFDLEFNVKIGTEAKSGSTWYDCG